MRARTHAQHKALEKKRTRRAFYKKIDALQGGDGWRKNVRLREVTPINMMIRAAFVVGLGVKLYEHNRADFVPACLRVQRKKQAVIKARAKVAANRMLDAFRASPQGKAMAAAMGAA